MLRRQWRLACCACCCSVRQPTLWAAPRFNADALHRTAGLAFTTVAIGRSTFTSERALTHFFQTLAADAPSGGARAAKSD